jgi:hypothetical protein
MLPKPFKHPRLPPGKIANGTRQNKAKRKHARRRRKKPEKVRQFAFETLGHFTPRKKARTWESSLSQTERWPQPPPSSEGKKGSPTREDNPFASASA